MALTPVNRQEEWYQQMINASTGNYLPSITSQDAGKVMTVESDGSWGVENVPTELPSVTSADETKVLTVDSNGDWVAADAPSGLPAVTDVDEGKVLTVNNSGVWVAANPASGGGVLVVTKTNGTLDKTWQQIVDAMSTTGAVLARYNDGSIDNLKTFLIADVDPKSGECTVTTGGGVGDRYTASSASGYPVQNVE